MASHKSLIKQFLEHKMMFSIAFSETGRVNGVQVRTVWILAALAVMITGAGGYLSELEKPDLQVIAANERKEADFESEIDRLKDVKSYQDEQFRIFAQELGVLQARLERFDMITEKLFNDDEIGKHLEKIEHEIGGKGDVDVPRMTETPSIEDLQAQLDHIHERADKVDVSMQAGLELIALSYNNNARQPYNWPVLHKRTYLSSSYGNRKDPFSGRRKWHSGVDIAGGWNAPIVASAAGVVVFSGYRYGFGNMVEIRHANGFSTRYAHMNKALAKNGEKVAAGETVGLMGSSGRSTGPHLHFEVLIDDKKVDPTPFIRGKYQAARKQARELEAQKAAFAK